MGSAVPVVVLRPLSTLELDPPHPREVWLLVRLREKSFLVVRGAVIGAGADVGAAGHANLE